MSIPLEQAEISLAEAITELLMDKGKREEYSRSSKIKSETLSINAAVDKWLELADTED